MGHRQIGASEAVYRLIPGFHLTESNVGCVFIATGYPENRESFFKKVSNEDSKPNQDDEMDIDAALEDYIDYYENYPHHLDEDNMEEDGTHIENIKLADRPGTYQQSTTMHEKYAFRPKRLEKMCFAQFCTIYVKTSKPKTGTVFD